MYSIIYDPEVKTFSVSTRMFAKGLPSIEDSDWNKLTSNQKDEFKKINDANKRIQWAKNHNVKIKQNNNNNNNNGGNKDKDKKNDDTQSNHWTKDSPKIYAFEKLLKKNLDELMRDQRVISYKKIGDNYAVETPNDVWLNIYVTADGTYIITKLEMDSGGYGTSSRRFNAIVAGPKDLRNIITNARSLEEPGFIRSLILRGVGRLTGTDIVDKINFKLW